jgi:Tfp pilus assembly protein PilO
MSDARKKQLIVGGAFAAVAIVILLGGYMFVISPKQASAARLQREAADTQSKLTLALAAARHPAPGTTNDASDLFRLSKAMPDEVDSSGAILDLVAAGKATGVTIDGLSTSDPLPATAGAYELVPVIATLHGRYGQLTNFLARVRRLVVVRHGAINARGRLFGVDSITLAPDPANSTTLKATVNFETYVYSSTVAPAPTTTTPPASSSDLTAAGATN